MIKVISFDGHGTLFRESSDHYQRIADFLDGPDCDRVRDVVYQMYSKLWYQYPLEASDDSICSFWLHVYREVGKQLRVSDFVVRAQWIYQATQSPSMWSPDKRGWFLYQQLSKQYPEIQFVYCLEWESTIRQIFRTYRFPEHEMFISSEQHVSKMSKFFWTSVLLRLNVTSKEIVHIGDSKQLDIISPQKSGISAFNISDHDAYYNIKTLIEQRSVD